jgi:hypothetical protein
MKAKLANDVIAIGSGLENYDKDIYKTETGRKLAGILKSKSWNLNVKKALRAQSVPAQEVEVLEIYNQKEHAQKFATPTLDLVVALVRAINFDGQEVTTVVGLSELVFEDGNQFISLDEYATARGIVLAALELNEIKKLFNS